jgi:hypothetical protein
MGIDKTTHAGDPRRVEIFVSYSAHSELEKELSSSMIDLLTNAFALPPRAIFAYTVPGRGAKSGARLLDELKVALADSKAVLAIITPAAAASSYGQFEMAASDLEGKFTVPLLPDSSLQEHVPVFFRDVTARSLASIGELCQLLEDLREPLGRATVEPACMWITNAERVVAAALASTGHVAAQARVGELTGELETSRRRYRSLRTTALATAIAGLAAGIAFAGLYATHTRAQYQNGLLQDTLKQRDAELTTYKLAIQEANTRNVLLPALRIHGGVTTASGRPAERALVAACAALPLRGGPGPSPAELCPEELRLNVTTDSDGLFTVNLRDLPLPGVDGRAPAGVPGSPLEEIWLLAQHTDGSRIEQRVGVKTVIDKNLTLR